MTKAAFLGMRGPLSTNVLGALVDATDLVFVGMPAAPPRTNASPARALMHRAFRALSHRPSEIEARARRAGVAPTTIHAVAHSDWQSALASAKPDLLVVAGFPWILPAEVLSIPRIGALNVHAALLPRHRGPLPLFWVYHADDRHTGVTAHWMTQHADAGDIVAQAEFPLPRGLAVDRLNIMNGIAAGHLVARILPSIIGRFAPRRQQDDRDATDAPFVKDGSRMVSFETWGVERVWHFLAGLHPRFIEPLEDERGERVRYTAVRGFTSRSPSARPGVVVGMGSRRDLACLDGHVHLRT
jgi:methionyl-tRNA formyltransferase